MQTGGFERGVLQLHLTLPPHAVVIQSLSWNSGAWYRATKRGRSQGLWDSAADQVVPKPN